MVRKKKEIGVGEERRKENGSGREENGSRESEGRERSIIFNGLKLISILRQLSYQDMLITVVPNATFPLQRGMSVKELMSPH